MSYVQHQNLYQNNAHQQATYTGVKIWVCGRVCILYHDILLHIFFLHLAARKSSPKQNAAGLGPVTSRLSASSIVSNTRTGWLECTHQIFDVPLHFVSGFVNCR